MFHLHATGQDVGDRHIRHSGVPVHGLQGDFDVNQITHPDGAIRKRFAIRGGPLSSDKQATMLFTLDHTRLGSTFSADTKGGVPSALQIHLDRAALVFADHSAG